MKRITCFITSLTSGGAEHQLTILASFLAEKGYNVELVTFGKNEDHYNFSPLINRVRIKHNGKSYSKLWSIYRYFLFVKTDCVISFGSRENFFCLIPLIFRPKIKVLAGERCATYKQLAWYKKVNYRCLYKRADFIVPNSYTQKEDIIQSWTQYGNKVCVINNYTDITEYQIAVKPCNTVIRIGIFCRFAEQKNYRRFAKVVKEIKENSNVKFEIHWYGNMHVDGKLLPQYVEMDGLRRKYHIEGCLFLHDHTKNVADLLKTFDALCLPSLFEGFSNSISEYICTGKPVLCSDVADNKVMVHDGENGYLFDPENEYSMVAAFMKFFALSNTDRDEMGKKSRAIAESLFDKDKFVESYINLIEQ